MAHYDYGTLETDRELQSKYAVEVRNRFSIEAANNSLLPKKPGKGRLTPRVIHGLIQLFRGLFLAKDRCHQDPSEEKREEVATKKDLLKACNSEVEEDILKD